MKIKRICAVVLALLIVLTMATGCKQDGQQASSAGDLSISQSQGELRIGEVLELTANKDNVIWVSSDSTVASVYDSKVTGIQDGIATISAVTESGEAACTITVKNSYFPLLKIQNKASTLFTNSEYTVSAGIYMGEELVNSVITWKSSDDAIASVSADGVVSAKSKGVVTITATAHYQDINLEDSMEIVVAGMSYIDAPSKIEMGLYAGDLEWEVAHTIYIDAKATNEKATITSQDSSIVSVKADGKLKAEKEGSTNITLTYEKDGESLEMVIPVSVERHVLHTFTKESECYWTGDTEYQNGSTIGTYWTTTKPVLQQGGQLSGENGTGVYFFSYYWNPALSFSLDITKEDLQRYQQLGYSKVVVPVYNVDPYSEGIQIVMGQRVSAELPANGWKEVEFSLSELIANYNSYAIKGTPIIKLQNVWAIDPNAAGGEVSFYIYFGDIYLR